MKGKLAFRVWCLNVFFEQIIGDWIFVFFFRWEYYSIVKIKFFKLPSVVGNETEIK